ncbi:MAG TPA: hypothetical protein VNU70_10865 [Puia sp.]|jgi:hypothetical protein|nr:hypothetical protein [Puia sp.]
MWSLLVITCIISQTAVAFFLLNGVRTDDDIDKHLLAAGGYAAVSRVWVDGRSKLSADYSQPVLTLAG